MGSRKFEEVGGGGGTLLIPGLGEAPSFSLLLRFPRPGDPYWPRACFLMGAVSQLFCFTPELLQVWPLEQRQKQHRELVRNADSRPYPRPALSTSPEGDPGICVL